MEVNASLTDACMHDLSETIATPGLTSSPDIGRIHLGRLPQEGVASQMGFQCFNRLGEPISDPVTERGKERGVDSAILVKSEETIMQ